MAWEDAQAGQRAWKALLLTAVKGLRPDPRSLGSQHGLTCILYRSLLAPKPPDRVGPSKKTGVFLSLHNLTNNYMGSKAWTDSGIHRGKDPKTAFKFTNPQSMVGWQYGRRDQPRHRLE